MANNNNEIGAQSRWFTSSGLKLHYLDWGNSSAPLLILVHGMWDHAHSWDFIAEHLSKKWHVVALDLRGHGDSEWSSEGAYAAPYFLKDFSAFWDHLHTSNQAYSQCSIIAHSFGGNATARFAALFPEKVAKLVLVDAMGPSDSVKADWHQQGAIARTKQWLLASLGSAQKKPIPSIADAASRLRRTNTLVSDSMALHLAQYGVRACDGGFAWKHDPQIGNFLPEDFAIDLAEYWGGIECPTLLCWGDKSWTTNPATDGRSELFKQPINKHFHGAGHWLHHDQRDHFCAVVADFL